MNYKLRSRMKHFVKTVIGKDLSNKGERVDIDLSKGFPKFDRLDVYQKSHFRRYEFVYRLINPKMIVGDFACGTGYGSVMLSRKAKHIYGVDIDDHLINKIKQRYIDISNVTFICEDVSQISALPPIDVIVSFETIEHLSENQIPLAFSRFNSLLKKGGLLVISTPFKQLETKQSRKYHRTFEIDEQKLTWWAKRAGLHLLEIHYQNYIDHKISSKLDQMDFQIGTFLKI